VVLDIQTDKNIQELDLLRYKQPLKNEREEAYSVRALLRVEVFVLHRIRDERHIDQILFLQGM
jgi:hypothetical protein